MSKKCISIVRFFCNKLLSKIANLSVFEFFLTVLISGQRLHSSRVVMIKQTIASVNTHIKFCKKELPYFKTKTKHFGEKLQMSTKASS